MNSKLFSEMLSKKKILIQPSNSESTNQVPPRLPNVSNENMDLLKAQAKYNLHKLRQALERHADPSSMHRYSHDKFSNEDMDTVMEAVFAASKNDYRLIIGAADFLTLLLSVEDHDEDEESEHEYGHEDDLCEVREMNDDISDCASSSEDEESRDYFV